MAGVNAGRIAAAFLVGSAVLAGGAMYYLQVYGYYRTLPPQSDYALTLADGSTATLSVSGFRGIDSASSPLRYRACMTLDGPLPVLADYPEPAPLNAPDWFDCFDARVLGEDLAAGRARAVLVEGNFRYGFDRVMALYPDRQAYVWPQVNACGTAHFDGRPLPEGCPPPPEE